jgi:hypothetical protein
LKVFDLLVMLSMNSFNLGDRHHFIYPAVQIGNLFYVLVFEILEFVDISLLLSDDTLESVDFKLVLRHSSQNVLDFFVFIHHYIVELCDMRLVLLYFLL